MLRAASIETAATGIVHLENQPSRVNSDIRFAGVNIGPGTDADRGATRAVDPRIATTKYQRMRSFFDAFVTLSCK